MALKQNLVLEAAQSKSVRSPEKGGEEDGGGFPVRAVCNPR